MADPTLDRRRVLCGGCAMFTLAACGGPSSGTDGLGTSSTGDTGSGGTVPPSSDPLANPDYPCNQQVDTEGDGWISFPLSLFPELLEVGGWVGMTVPNTNPAQQLIAAQVQAGCWVAAARPCTHQGVLVNYDPARGQFVCPRHASLFDWRGQPVGGPATVGLEVYTCGVVGDRFWVRIG